MKYYRLMNEKELAKVLNGETLTREGQKHWFHTANVFYFISEEEGGLETLQEISCFFIGEETMYLIQFESNLILEKIWDNDENIFESICEFYSINTMKPTGFIKIPKELVNDFWMWDDLTIGIPHIPIKRIKNDLSKSFNDRNYIANKIFVKKEILNRRKNRWFKYAIR